MCTSWLNQHTKATKILTKRNKEDGWKANLQYLCFYIPLLSLFHHASQWHGKRYLYWYFVSLLQQLIKKSNWMLWSEKMRRLKTESRITSYEFIHVFTSHKTFQGNEQYCRNGNDEKGQKQEHTSHISSLHKSQLISNLSRLVMWLTQKILVSVIPTLLFIF